MAEELILRPNAAGDYSQANPSGYDKVDEATPDEDITYVQVADDSDQGKEAKELYNLPDHNYTGVINSVTLYIRGKIIDSSNNFSHVYSLAKINGTYYQDDINIDDFDYTTKSKTWTTNPKTGVAWTWNDINNMQVGVRLWAWNGGTSGTKIARCTQVYIVVNYNSPPTVTTQAASAVGKYIATLNGNITATGGDNATVRGFQYKIGEDGDVTTTSENGSFGTGAYTKDITGLTGVTTYRYRAYATNPNGTGYGDWVEFTTDNIAPTVTTQSPTDVLPTTVTANGNITALGGENATVRGFKYGLTQVDTWDAHDDGDFGAGAFTKGLTGLSANTTYWIRSYATNSIGTSYSSWVQFQTAAVGVIPTGTKLVICSDYSGYTYKTMRSETDDGEAYTAYFVISTDLTNKQALSFNKKILDLFLYFNREDSGSVSVYVKRDSETTWQDLGSVTLTGTTDIVKKHLAPVVLGHHFLFKIEGQNHFEFLGVLFKYIPKGER